MPSRLAVAACVACLVVAATATARAQPAGPVRIAVECESYGRTKACPAFLLGFVDANKALLASPRAAAEVVLYVSSTQVALADRVHLRFVGQVMGAPPVVEVDVELDSRADDDTQRGQLAPGFLRGVALFVGARHPGLVTIALAAPETTTIAKPSTTPWGGALTLGGFGNLFGSLSSKKNRYINLSGFTNINLSRLERTSRVAAGVYTSGGVNRSPPLMLDDGTTVSLDTKQWFVSVNGSGAWLYDDCWSFGGSASAFRNDPKDQFSHGFSARAGVEWDKYPADDPRGNRLAVLYFAGYNVERYNIRNEIGQTFAHYPTHGVIASGTLREDKIGVGISLEVGGEVIHPSRRFHVSASPFVEWQLGGHVDVSASFSITRREFPGPDESQIDPSDYELQLRLSYAQPLSMNGSLNLSIHWDRTNGARNDRFSDI